MTYCANESKGPCHCQPQEGIFCPFDASVATTQQETEAVRSELTAARGEIENLKFGQIKTDNSQTLVNALEEIEALKLANRDLRHWFEDARDEAERLQGRVSELEATVQLAVENAKDDDPDVWIQIDRVLAADNSRAWLLRRQADAVEKFAECLSGTRNKRLAQSEVDRLRLEADELEAGGDDA